MQNHVQLYCSYETTLMLTRQYNSGLYNTDQNMCYIKYYSQRPRKCYNDITVIYSLIYCVYKPPALLWHISFQYTTSSFYTTEKSNSDVTEFYKLNAVLCLFHITQHYWMSYVTGENIMSLKTQNRLLSLYYNHYKG